MPVTDGSTLRGLWHRSMVGQVPWLGRCFDLSKAYKQVPVAEDSLKYGVLAMPDENNAWSFYISRSLPFGAGASVFAFNKLSRALWHIMVHKLGLILGVFVDDFPAMEVEDLAPMTTQIVSTFFSVLGWKHATEGKKAVEFAPSWVALGVRFDFTLLSSGRLIVANKEGRLARIVHLAERLESQEPCSTAVASTLHGLLNFAGGYVLGQSLKPAARAVSAILFRKAAPSQGRLREIIALVKCVTERARPRVIEVNDQSRPLIIYTDGSFENGTGRWAAMIFDPRSRDRSVVHALVHQRLIDHWERVVGKQVICEVEMYAYLMARLAWTKICANRGGIVFIDNDATLACLIRATSKSDAMFRIVTVLSVLDTCSAFGPWFERVPSPANPADWPTKRLGSGSMLSGSDSRGRAQPWQKSTEPLALTSTREKCYGRLKTVKSKNGKKQGTAKPALSRKVQDFEGCLSPCRTMTWSKEDWRFSIQNSPSARFAIWSANTSRKRSFWQVYGLCTLALLVSTWELSSAPHAFQSWEKASLVSGTSIWDEPNNHELIGRGPTADAESERACKRVGEDVGRRNMTRFCVAVQVGWNTFLDNCHHCNVCSRCLLAPCLCSQRTWPARIPLLAVREKTRHRHRMAPQRMPLRMFFSSRTVASSCFRRQPCGSLRRCSNSSQRSKLHTSPKQISTWKSLSRTIRYNETPCKGSPKFGSHPLRDAEVEGGRTDRKLRAWCKQRKRPPRECMTDSCLK